ncbi:MAG: DUF4625 domain-containing protein [Prevotellaceae bacterium]|nr:DUF4625 domain-containing protein [Prevotella sp.]MDD7257555.1 DUF4625 domain-containing protein [Prevotellaceae bacterium]MDY6130663.1 DUF4625 domain-containing protein [Prevotella sp.]
MKNRMKMMSLSLLSTLLMACGGEDDAVPKDMESPKITNAGITANPIDCQIYRRGDVIPFQFVFTDNAELGEYNIEIHNNFNHHTHSTSAVECPLDAKKNPVNPWIYNQTYPIPKGQKTHKARVDIKIPTGVDTGDYHFMIRLTDQVGHQEIKGITIKITE